ncbi:MAG: DinB family protein [Actinomycetota bacterium]|nr:DinB family protein [Actinomycetota bacterium]
MAATGDLAVLSVGTLRNGSHVSLRWVVLHMIEETARHAGHADLVRESIDGETGE